MAKPEKAAAKPAAAAVTSSETTVATAEQGLSGSGLFRKIVLWTVLALVVVIGFVWIRIWIAQRTATATQTHTAVATSQNTGPTYPIEGNFTINQDGWSSPIIIHSDEYVRVVLIDADVWLDTRVNGEEPVLRQAPRNSGHWSPNNLGMDTGRTLEYRVTPGTKKQSGKISYTITKKS